MKCPKCGSEVSGKFCTNCGTRLDDCNSYHSIPPIHVEPPVKKKWYTKTWFTIFMLLFFFPVGLCLMWQHRKWNKPVKIIITAIYTIMFLYTLLADAPSDSEPVEPPQVVSEQETEQETIVEPEKPVVKEEKEEIDDNTIDAEMRDCHIKYVSHEVTDNYADDKCVAVYYEFTNNSEENKTFGYLVDAKAFQNGIQLEDSLFFTENDDKTTYSEIKPGTTTTVCMAYELRDDSDVTLEITKYFRDKIEDSMVIKLK